MRLSVVSLFVLLAGAAACSSGGEGAAPAQALPGASNAKCSTIIADGAPTPSGSLPSTCVDDAGAMQVIMTMSYKCTDGRRLMWNMLGWGFEGEPFHVAKVSAPPEEANRVCKPWG